MARITVLVGPPGSGKSTFAVDYARKHPCPPNCTIISQDSQGREGHLKLFESALSAGSDLIIDRMNFDKNQRNRYLSSARKAGYDTRIIVFDVHRDTCIDRCNKRDDHPTIKEERTAKTAVDFYFLNFEQVMAEEADEIMRVGSSDFIRDFTGAFPNDLPSYPTGHRLED